MRARTRHTDPWGLREPPIRGRSLDNVTSWSTEPYSRRRLPGTGKRARRPEERPRRGTRAVGLSRIEHPGRRLRAGPTDVLLRRPPPSGSSARPRGATVTHRPRHSLFPISKPVASGPTAISVPGDAALEGTPTPTR